MKLHPLVTRCLCSFFLALSLPFSSLIADDKQGLTKDFVVEHSVIDSMIQRMSDRELLEFIIVERSEPSMLVAADTIDDAKRTPLSTLKLFDATRLQGTNEMNLAPIGWELLVAGQDSEFVTEYGRTLGAKIRQQGYSVILISLAEFALLPQVELNDHLEVAAQLAEGFRNAGVYTLFSDVIDWPLSAMDNPSVLPSMNALFAGRATGFATRTTDSDWERPSTWEPNYSDASLSTLPSLRAVFMKPAENGKAVDYIQNGADMLLVSSLESEVLSALQESLRSGVLSRSMLENKAKRVMEVTLWVRHMDTFMDNWNLRRNENEVEFRKRVLVESGMTLLKNENNLVPIRDLVKNNITLVEIGTQSDPRLQELLWRYASGRVLRADKGLLSDLDGKATSIDPKELVILLARPDGSRSMSDSCRSVIENICSSNPVILVWTGPAKALVGQRFMSEAEAVICMKEHSDYAFDYALQGVFGGRAIKGELRKGNADFQRGFGLKTEKIRLGYGVAEEVGIRTEDLIRIDEIAHSGVAAKAYPGAQVWIAKDGIVVVNKAYGFHTYDSLQPVQTTDIYDLASITKIAASTVGLMKLTDMGRFNLEYNLCDYLGDWVDTTEYMNMNLRDILAHQAGLPVFIPFAAQTTPKGIPRFDIYSIAQNETYPLRVAREFYIRHDYPDVMFRQVIKQPISPDKKYKYSDVGYYFTLRITERQSGMKLNDFLDSTFYRPMGMTTMGYLPLQRFDKTRIAPTEYDRLFRKQLIHGDVHDPGAAMLGGVGGHAGLFSNANDLGKMMQMMLDGGNYGGLSYLKPETISEFVRCQFCDSTDNRRGAGFDKPLRSGGAGPSCGCTDLDAFGHQGFTGTVTWADPRDNVVYVFLSNRVYPDAENKKLAEMNIRTDIQKAFYTALNKTETMANGNQK